MRVLSAGMGRQCSAILALVEAGKIPAYDLIVFADTHLEPDDVYQNLRYWQARGHNIQVVSEGDLSKRLDVIPLYVNGKPKHRQCTREYKIKPIRDAILSALQARGLVKTNKRNQRRVKHGVRVVQSIGFSSNEMYRVSRKNRNPAWLTNDYPLIELGMTAADCVRLLKRLGHPVVSSACVICPYLSDERLKAQPDHERARVIKHDEYLTSAEFLTHHPRLKGATLHKSGRRMAEVYERLDSLPRQSVFDGFQLEALEACNAENANCMT